MNQNRGSIKPTGSIPIICSILIMVILVLLGYIWTYHNDSVKMLSTGINITDQQYFYQEKDKVYVSILEKVSKVFKTINAPFFLSSGTCLGYYRENNFIKYDYDIDIGMMVDDYSYDLVTEMEKEGLMLYRTLGNQKTGLELSFKLLNSSIGNYAKVDIFTHHKEVVDGKNYLYWSTYRKPDYTEQIKYRVPEFSLRKTTFKGVNVGVPYPTESYLSNHYGSDWRIPKRPFIDYNYFESPVSIVR